MCIQTHVSSPTVGRKIGSSVKRPGRLLDIQGAIILCQIARVPMECVPDYSQDALAIIDRTKDREMREYKHQDPYIFSLRLAFWKIVDQS